MPVEANDLMLFARVVEFGSFSKAAEQVNLPKSTVSRRIAGLETALGQRLLQRTTRRLILTDFGASVLEHARRLAGEVDAASALAQHRQDKPSGRLRISMPSDFAQLAMMPVLAAYMARYPGVMIELDLSPRRVDVLGENFDLVIRMGSRIDDDNTLVARQFLTTRFFLYASPAYLARRGTPSHPDDLIGHDALCLRRHSGEPLPWILTHGKARWERVMEARMVANSPDVLAHFARMGYGIAAASAQQALAFENSGELVRILPEWSMPNSVAWALYPGRKLMPAKTRAFLELLTEMPGSELA